MPQWEICTDKVKIDNGDLQIAAYLAQPIGEGPFPGVVVLQEIFGVNSHIRDVTERIAKEGYVAIAPALYQRLAPDFETGYTPADVQIGRGYKMQTKASELQSDIAAAINYLKNLPNVKHSFGCIGFCFGGHVAYLAATNAEIKATASFYGAGIANMPLDDRSDRTIAQTQNIKGTIYAFFGTQDASIPSEQVDQIEAELKKHSISHRVFRYDGAEHGFFCEQRGSYNPTSAADAWKQVKQLFEQEL